MTGRFCGNAASLPMALASTAGQEDDSGLVLSAVEDRGVEGAASGDSNRGNTQLYFSHEDSDLTPR